LANLEAKIELYLFPGHGVDCYSVELSFVPYKMTMYAWCRSVITFITFRLWMWRVQVSDDSSGSDRSDRYCYHRSTGLVHRHRFVLFDICRVCFAYEQYQ